MSTEAEALTDASSLEASTDKASAVPWKVFPNPPLGPFVEITQRCTSRQLAYDLLSPFSSLSQMSPQTAISPSGPTPSKFSIVADAAIHATSARGIDARVPVEQVGALLKELLIEVKEAASYAAKARHVGIWISLPASSEETKYLNKRACDEIAKVAMLPGQNARHVAFFVCSSPSLNAYAEQALLQEIGVSTVHSARQTIPAGRVIGTMVWYSAGHFRGRVEDLTLDGTLRAESIIGIIHKAIQETEVGCRIVATEDSARVVLAHALQLGDKLRTIEDAWLAMQKRAFEKLQDCLFLPAIVPGPSHFEQEQQTGSRPVVTPYMLHMQTKMGCHLYVYVARLHVCERSFPLVDTWKKQMERAMLKRDAAARMAAASMTHGPDGASQQKPPGLLDVSDVPPEACNALWTAYTRYEMRSVVYCRGAGLAREESTLVWTKRPVFESLADLLSKSCFLVSFVDRHVDPFWQHHKGTLAEEGARLAHVDLEKTWRLAVDGETRHAAATPHAQCERPPTLYAKRSLDDISYCDSVGSVHSLLYARWERANESPEPEEKRRYYRAAVRFFTGMIATFGPHTPIAEAYELASTSMRARRDDDAGAPSRRHRESHVLQRASPLPFRSADSVFAILQCELVEEWRDLDDPQGDTVMRVLRACSLDVGVLSSLRYDALLPVRQWEQLEDRFAFRLFEAVTCMADEHAASQLSIFLISRQAEQGNVSVSRLERSRWIAPQRGFLEEVWGARSEERAGVIIAVDHFPCFGSAPTNLVRLYSLDPRPSRSAY